MKHYEAPELTVIAFAKEDVITTSTVENEISLPRLDLGGND